MKITTIITLITTLFLSVLDAKLTIISSIAPQQAFIQEIAGDNADVILMVPQGTSPHTYEPKPSQMKAISKADAYFKIGVEFEDVWMEKFKTQNPSMKTVDITEGITKLQMDKHHHHDDEDKEENSTNKPDPHVWTSAKNIKIMGDNIADALVALDPKHASQYRQSQQKFAQKADKLQASLEKVLTKDYHFMVFHPEWGYLAHDFNLHQMPIEAEGKSIKPKTMISLINQAKDQNVTVIFTSPAFSDQIAKQMAHELNIKVQPASTLKKEWYNNILNVANLIAKQR